MRDVVVICRISSRHGSAYYRRLVEELPKRDVTIVEAHMVRRRKELRARIRQAVAFKAPCIVVVGGDGTQTAAVGELAFTNTVMAVVPAGTGNSFALGLGIKDDLDLAIDTIAHGKEIRVDVGIVNGTRFANFASVGVIADAAARTPKVLKKLTGPLAYGATALALFFREKPFEMRVERKHRRMKITTFQAIVTSGRYFGWQPVTPDAQVRDGKLAFFAKANDTVPGAIATNAAILGGVQTKLEGAHYFSARKLVIKTKPKQPLNVDGHALGKTPAKFSIAPGALRVLVPQDFSEPA